MYHLFYLFSLLPLGLLYLLADLIAGLMHSVVRYRRKVVRENLSSAFPEWDARRLKAEERKFYRYLADYFVETVKLTTMSEKQMRRRMRFEGFEMINGDLASGKCVSLFLGHYGNWEWISSIPLHITVAEAHPCQIYHRLRNRTSDTTFLRLRSRFNATCVPMDESLNVIAADYRAGVPNITGYIADQAPKYASLHHFVDFLNHDTAVLTGAERLSRMTKAAVYYCDVVRPRRGYYLCRFVPMTPDASRLPKFELTDTYYSLLEQSIRRCPHLWLWSHRRWKHTRAKFIEHYPDDWQRRLSRL